MNRNFFFILYLPCLLQASLNVKIISYDEILAAMKTQTGYNVIATTNVARFQGSVLINIAKSSLQEDPNQKLLYVDSQVWYQAYKEYTGFSDQEMPEYSIYAVKYRQDQLLDLRHDKVIKNITGNQHPQLAMNAVVGWKEGPEFYSFNDTLSNPTLKVRNSRRITYRILDFGPMFMYDEMQGLAGQPTSGILGWIFQFIGEGHVIWSKLAITPTNEEVVRARAKKGIFEIESTLTIFHDGTTEKNLPKGRKDLEYYEKLVTEPLSIEYYPMDTLTIQYICGE
ncbi:MAG: hypothetical protein JXQ65_06765 [Candidatus Marinimicrobia bacterium]|nr:hypothetical protein [Candidatus Neomarinimicrobiota bacterium]